MTESIIINDEQIESRNEQWEKNHELILNTYWQLRSQNPMKRPTNSEIARISGLSRVTVIKHMQSLTLTDESMNEHKKYRDDVIYGLALKAQEGDAAAAKLYFEIVYGWTPKTEIKKEIITKNLTLNFNSNIESENKNGNDEVAE
jgi:hypothetical protein